jgi:hypothetical protein
MSHCRSLDKEPSGEHGGGDLAAIGTVADERGDHVRTFNGLREVSQLFAPIQVENVVYQFQLHGPTIACRCCILRHGDISTGCLTKACSG